MSNMGVNSAQYGILFSLFSMPAILTCIMTGTLIDYVGVNKMLIPLSMIVTFGMLIQTFGA